MTIRYAIRETETHPGKFPNGLDTSVEEVYAAQGEDFHNPPQAWALTVLSPYSSELPKVTAYRTREGAKAAMEADIKETLDADDLQPFVDRRAEGDRAGRPEPDHRDVVLALERRFGRQAANDRAAALRHATVHL